MDPRDFVRARRDRWIQLNDLLDRVDKRGWKSLQAHELWRAGVLYRYAAADLSRLRTLAPDSSWVERLNGLVLRAHARVYQAPRATWGERLRGLAWGPPRALRRNLNALYAAGLLFLAGTMIGGLLTFGDSAFAEWMLGPQWTASVREGRYWIEETFAIIPHSLAAAGVMTNNLSVAITAYATGITGLFPFYMMVMNGMMLGSVLSLTAQNGLFDRTIGFVTGHGVIEISAILVAGAAGFTVFDGWLHPEEGTRLQGLQRGARDGLWMLLAAFVGLWIAGPIEGYVSPVEEIPVVLRVTLGCAVGLAYWAWLLAAGREPEDADDTAAS